MRTNTHWICTLLAIFPLLAGGCGFAPTVSSEPQPTPMTIGAQVQATAFLPVEEEPQPAEAEALADYPASPEEVVRAFLAAYQVNPAQMSQYLGQGLRSSLPEDGAAMLLRLTGMLEGFVIDSAVVSPQPPLASISVAIRAGGSDTRRRFLLSVENDQWKIRGIEQMEE